MLKNTQETAVNTVEVTLLIEREEFNKAVNEAYKKEVKKIQIPGFRKGKAPRAIIEKMYGKGVFFESALNSIAPAKADAAIAECGFKPVATPEISDVDFENEEGVIVKVTFTRRPDVKLGEYKGIKATKTTVSVEDAQVDAELANVQKRYARTIEVTDRAAENGDITTIDYEGFVDGVPFAGGKAEGHKLTLGSGAFIPGFEDQIVGKSVSDEAFEIDVKFPEEYHAEELKGKDAQFKVILHKIEKEELPELDDEFAKDASEFDTIAEYKADIRAKMEKRNADEADRRLSADLSEELAKLVEAEIPTVMYDKEVELLVREYDLNLRQQGLSLDMLIQYTGMTLDSIKQQYRAIAEVNVKKNLALEEIIKAEAIKATAEDVEKRYEEIANAYNMKVEEVKKSLPSENLEEEVQSIKAFDIVKAAAKVTEKTVTAAELQAEEEAKAQAAKEETEEKKPAPKKRAPRKKKTEETKAEEEPKTDAE
ncbi:MAG: trigger factor [Clostridia bacterium]|nr:trigger factor [Clostridia bacterium]